MSCLYSDRVESYTSLRRPTPRGKCKEKSLIYNAGVRSILENPPEHQRLKRRQHVRRIQARFIWNVQPAQSAPSGHPAGL